MQNTVKKILLTSQTSIKIDTAEPQILPSLLMALFFLVKTYHHITHKATLQLTVQLEIWGVLC